MKFILLIITTFLFCDTSYSQEVYHFDSTAIVNGCHNVVLQKISADNRYEIVIDINMDSIPKFKEFEISRYSKFITIYLIKYARGNLFVNSKCNDVIVNDPAAKRHDRYVVVQGTFIITAWQESEAVISATFKKMLLQNNTKQTIALPVELFDQLKLVWIGG